MVWDGAGTAPRNLTDLSEETVPSTELHGSLYDLSESPCPHSPEFPKDVWSLFILNMKAVPRDFNVRY